MNFQSSRKLRAKAGNIFRGHRRRIARLLPSAEIQHIGSTAISGATTKGDLDVLVRVSRDAFARANKLLSARYARNTESLRSRSFASFKDDKSDPPTGIQLVVRGSAQDHFQKFRDAMNADASLVRRYNELKGLAAGRSMAEYRRRKGKFIQKVLASCH
jgi:GrpB-like predicted nucleotidyltransferase (UPF0157 family)